MNLWINITTYCFCDERQKKKLFIIDIYVGILNFDNFLKVILIWSSVEKLRRELPGTMRCTYNWTYLS